MIEKSTWTEFSEQSKFFWGFQQTIAFVEIAVFSGWYTIYTSNLAQKIILSYGILFLGIFVLFVLFLIIKRAGQYLEQFRPENMNVGKPFLGIRTSLMGWLIPLALIIFNVLLILFTTLS